MGIPALFSSRTSFRNQLFLIITIGVVGLALTAALTTAWITSQQVRALFLEEGLQITDSLAKQSVVALLYESDSSGAEAAGGTLAFPAIGHVAIFNRSREVIYAADVPEVAAEPLPTERLSWVVDKPQVILEQPEAWHFMAPVYWEAGSEGQAEDIFVKQAAGTQLLGHVYVLMGTGVLQEIRFGIFTNNLAVGALFAGLILLFMNLSLERLMQPLNTLTRVMEQAESSPHQAYAEPSGPREVVRIARVYNRMMDALAERDRRLREHNERLEQTVAHRTRELVLARNAALESSRHKSEFLANMSHELRTPLQSVIGYTDYVIETLVEEGMEECLPDLEKVLQNARQLLTLINEVLDFSKSDAGRMELHLEQAAIAPLLQQAAETVAPAMTEHGNRLALQLETAGPVTVDTLKLRQVALNLLSNAAKFTHNGEVVLRAVQRPQLLEITVSDSGIGIDPQQQEFIFEPFRQVDGSITRRFGGTGLGLAITRQFCHLMGGDVSVSSRPGEGASFHVAIPLPVQLPSSAWDGPSPDNGAASPSPLETA